MARLDVKDKDPFANTDAEPKDNVSASGFFARLILRFGLYRLFWFLISGAVSYLIYQLLYLPWLINRKVLSIFLPSIIFLY